MAGAGCTTDALEQKTHARTDHKLAPGNRSCGLAIIATRPVQLIPMLGCTMRKCCLRSSSPLIVMCIRSICT